MKLSKNQVQRNAQKSIRALRRSSARIRSSKKNEEFQRVIKAIKADLGGRRRNRPNADRQRPRVSRSRPDARREAQKGFMSNPKSSRVAQKTRLLPIKAKIRYRPRNVLDSERLRWRLLGKQHPEEVLLKKP